MGKETIPSFIELDPEKAFLSQEKQAKESAEAFADLLPIHNSRFRHNRKEQELDPLIDLKIEHYRAFFTWGDTSVKAIEEEKLVRRMSDIGYVVSALGLHDKKEHLTMFQNHLRNRMELVAHAILIAIAQTEPDVKPLLDEYLSTNGEVKSEWSYAPQMSNLSPTSSGGFMTASTGVTSADTSKADQSWSQKKTIAQEIWRELTQKGSSYQEHLLLIKAHLDEYPQSNS